MDHPLRGRLRRRHAADGRPFHERDRDPRGNDLATFPDFPAEIRAPAGHFGVSGFQLHFADHDILTPGDAPNVLVAMNPAALRTNVNDLPKGGMLIVDTDTFKERNLQKAGYEANPLEDGSLEDFHLHEVAPAVEDGRGR